MTTSKPTTKSYTTEWTVRRIQSAGDFDYQLLEFIDREAPRAASLIGMAFNCDVMAYAQENFLIVLYKNGRPVGWLMARLYEHAFDPGVKVLFQDSIYVTPGVSRAAHILMRLFIDLGKRHADHIITMIATGQTNIKPRSLEKLGFKAIETQYRMEIER